MKGPISYKLYKIDNGKEIFFRLVRLFYGMEDNKVEKLSIKECLEYYDLGSGDDDMTYWLMSYEEVNL